MFFTGVVLLDSKQRIYLIKEDDRNKIGKDRWNLPGGGVDISEGLIESARRETFEETGYKNEVKSLVGVYKATKGDTEWVYVVFESFADTESDAKSKVVDKSVKAGKWFDKDEFLNLDKSEIVHPDMFTVYEIAISGRGLALETVKFIEY